MKIYRAYYDSRNFSFEAYSQSKTSARFHLLTGLRKHGEQYDLDPDWFMFGESDGIEVVEFNMDTPYRDCSEIKVKTNTQLSKAKSRKEERL